MKILIIYLLYAAAVSIALWRKRVEPRSSTQAADAPLLPERVLIIGATGGTGRELVKQALASGLEVTALVRNPAKLDMTHARLRVVTGDVLDQTAVAGVMQGQDAVLCALGHKRFIGPTRILSEGTRNIVRAMDTHGVRRLVCETALGFGDKTGRLGLLYTLFVVPMVLPFYFWDKTRQEQIVAASSLDWIIVRPGVLTNGTARGRYRHGASVGSLITTVRIARADVAEFMLEQLTDATYLHSAVGLAW